MGSRLTIIHTHFHKRRTGVTRSIENVIPELKKLVPTFLYGYGIKGDLISTSELKKKLFSEEDIVVHCHRNNEIIRMLWYRFLGARFKIVSTRHAETSPSGLTKFLLKKSDEVITLTNSMSNRLGIRNTKVPHGVNTDEFIPKKEVFLKEISQKNIILCAGRVRKAKGQKILLEALASRLNEFPDWGVVIVGKVDKPAFLEELKKIAAENNIRGQVYFIDETSDIVSYYQAANIAVVPSFSEGFSLVCAEAMACGNTTIATKDVGVHSELIEDGKTGYLFKVGDVKSLGDLIIGMIKGEVSDLGDEARKEIISKWSAKKEAEGLLAVYQKCIKK